MPTRTAATERLIAGQRLGCRRKRGGVRCGALRGAGKRAELKCGCVGWCGAWARVWGLVFELKCSCVGWCVQFGWHLHARLLLVRAEMNFSAAMALGDCAEVARDTHITISSSGSRNRDGFRDRIPVCIITASTAARSSLEARTGRRQCDGLRGRWADGRRVPRRFN